jgi:hypothetical protein
VGSKYYGYDISNPPKHFQGKDSEYFGCETLTYWFPWLGGGGSKYYVCDLSNPPKTFSLWGFRILWLKDIDSLNSMLRRRGLKILWLRYIELPETHFRVGI